MSECWTEGLPMAHCHALLGLCVWYHSNCMNMQMAGQSLKLASHPMKGQNAELFLWMDRCVWGLLVILWKLVFLILQWEGDFFLIASHCSWISQDSNTTTSVKPRLSCQNHSLWYYFCKVWFVISSFKFNPDMGNWNYVSLQVPEIIKHLTLPSWQQYIDNKHIHSIQKLINI